MRRLIAIGLIALVGCTPAQTAAWLRWHADDPETAVAFLDTEQGKALLAETPSDGPQFEEYLSANGSPGDCDSYVPLFQKYGLPTSTFRAIAWRESGCDHTSFVIDRDDAGGGLLGINLKGYQQATTFYQWCGVTLANVTDAETNVKCASVAFQKMGMAPWR